MNLPLVISVAALVVVASLFYLRLAATRAGLKQEKEHWMVFGVFAGTIAGAGISKDNLWVSLIGLFLAVFGVVFHARLFIEGVRKKEPNQPVQRTPGDVSFPPVEPDARRL